MTAQIIKFDPRDASTPDLVLERAMGEFQNVVVIGYDHDGDLDCRADLNTSRKEILWLVEQFKLFLLTGGDSDE
jgi:hypothetical protein